jgi:hypothetical protein
VHGGVSGGGASNERQSYVTRAETESTMKAAAETVDVWLRGNPRPAAVGAAVLVLAGGAAFVAAWACGAPAAALVALAAAGGVGVAFALGLLAAAMAPRLERRGGSVRIRLAPLAAHDVPLEIVECVFPGSQPLGDAAGAGPRRVGTVVMRLAERATAWRSRPTFAAWGSWQDGHVVIDGRWCEPLSLEVTRHLGQRILEAKREVAAACGPPGEAGCG